MTDENPQDRLPEPKPTSTGPVPIRIGDTERTAAVQRIQRAMATGHLEFDEIGDRFETVYQAQTSSQLESVVADLPVLVAATPAHPAPSVDFTLLGDTQKGGFGDVGEGYTSINIIGDTKLDLTSVDFSKGNVNITCWSLIGDVKIIVADGVRVQRGGVSLISDEKDALVPPLGGAPLIKINVYQLLGDTKVYSLSLLPSGRLRRWWRKLHSDK